MPEFREGYVPELLRPRFIRQRPYRCERCNAEKPPLFILKDELWLSIAEKGDLLCFACCEEHLGRPLTWADMREEVPMNHLMLLGLLVFNQSPQPQRERMQELAEWHTSILTNPCRTFGGTATPGRTSPHPPVGGPSST